MNIESISTKPYYQAVKDTKYRYSALESALKDRNLCEGTAYIQVRSRTKAQLLGRISDTKSDKGEVEACEMSVP